MSETNQEKNQDILSDYYAGYQQLELESAETQVKKARNALFFVAGLTLVVGLIQLGGSNSLDGPSLAVLLVVTGIFAGLALLTKKKPFAAIVLGLIIYLGLWAVDVIVLGTEHLFRGILFKGIIIYFLVKGLKHGREAERLRNELHQLK